MWMEGSHILLTLLFLFFFLSFFCTVSRYQRPLFRLFGEKETLLVRVPRRSRTTNCAERERAEYILYVCRHGKINGTCVSAAPICL